MLISALKHSRNVLFQKNIDYLVVPKECKWTLPVDNAYIFFCKLLATNYIDEEGGALA